MNDHENKFFKILVRRPDGRTFTYTVNEYRIIDSGATIEFYDKKTNETIRVPYSGSEIRVCGGEEWRKSN